MRRSLRLLGLLAAVLLIALPYTPDAAAQDKPPEPEEPDTANPETGTPDSGDPDADRAYRLDLVRRMDDDQKARLRRALEEFRRLPPEKQQELRDKAKEIGAERLIGLGGKDVDELRKRHDAMRKRREALLDLIGPERLSGLTDDERAYVRSLATRRFHEYYKNSMLKLMGPTDQTDWKNLPEDERRTRMRQAHERFEAAVLAKRSDDERAAYGRLADNERKAMMRDFLESEHQRLVMTFAPVFDRVYLTPFLKSPPEERAKQVERSRAKGRWYEVRKLLFGELSREYRQRLMGLRPDQLAKVREIWEKGAELTPAERRTSAQTEIDRLYAESAAAGDEGRFRPPQTTPGGHAPGGGGEQPDDGRRRRGPRRAPR